MLTQNYLLKIELSRENKQVYLRYEISWHYKFRFKYNAVIARDHKLFIQLIIILFYVRFEL